jgi:hypothetical protein
MHVHSHGKMHVRLVNPTGNSGETTGNVHMIQARSDACCICTCICSCEARGQTRKMFYMYRDGEGLMAA